MFFRSDPKWEVIEPLKDIGESNAEFPSSFVLYYCKVLDDILFNLFYYYFFGSALAFFIDRKRSTLSALKHHNYKS